MCPIGSWLSCIMQFRSCPQRKFQRKHGQCRKYSIGVNKGKYHTQLRDAPPAGQAAPECSCVIYAARQREDGFKFLEE